MQSSWTIKAASALILASFGISVAHTQPAAQVRVTLQSNTLSINSYTMVRVRVTPNSAIPDNDIELIVPDGPAGGDATLMTVQGKPARRLCAGFGVGHHLLVARRISTGATLAQVQYSIINRWRSKDVGPSTCVHDSSPPPGLQYSWGGGPSGPQNFPVVPATGPKPVAIILLDTSDQRLPTDATALGAIRDAWSGAFGAAAPAPSVDRYYNEISYGQLLVTGSVVGPIHLDGAWADYFTNGDTPSLVWAPIGNTMASEAISKADPSIEFSQFKTIIFASASPSNAQFAWPATWDAYISTNEGEQHFGLTSMAIDWHAVDPRPDPLEIYETASHELGHTLGLADQYPYAGEDPGAAGRRVLGWDPMDDEKGLPDFAIAHRIKQGWLKPDWIKAYNFSGGAVPPPGGDNITLTPIEIGPPAAGQFSGIEVRLADGWNYYFEYRRMQTGQAGDQALPTDQVAVGYDVTSSGYNTPIPRRALLLLPKGPSNKDGPILALNQTYEERDPSFPADLDVKVIDIAPDHATLNIQYGANGHSDPSIRPWPTDEDHQWQSPDIEVRNDRNAQGDPTSDWYNVPWSGHTNTLVAKIRNSGDADAPGVTVRFSVFDLSLGGVPPQFVLGEVVKDVPKGGVPIEFSLPWVPGNGTHYCIQAQIELYQDPVTKLVEKTELNNFAQTNYTRFISSSGSPYSRESGSFKVRNPTGNPAFVTLIPSQSNPLYRSFLEYSWIHLAAGESRSVSVESEYAGDEIQRRMETTKSPIEKNRLSRLLEIYRNVPNHLSIKAQMQHIDTHDASAVTLGGADIRIDRGDRTRTALAVQADHVSGRVTLAHGGPAPNGAVIVSVLRSNQSPASAPLDSVVHSEAGAFEARLPTDWASVSAYYVGARGVADSTSATIPRSSP